MDHPAFRTQTTPPVRGDYAACTELLPDDREQLDRTLESLPLVADVMHADLLVYAQAGSHIVITAHIAPHPVPSLYPHPQTGHLLERGLDPDPVFRVLADGRRQPSISGTLVWGAPTFQEVLPIVSSDGRMIAAVATHANLLEHERFQQRDARFRSAVTRIRDQALAGRLQGAANLSRFTEYDGVLIIDKGGTIEYMNSAAENQYRRLGYVDNLVGEQISHLDTNEYICFRSMERGQCLEQRIQEEDQVWIKRVIPLFPVPTQRRFPHLRAVGVQPREGAAIFIQDITEEVRQEQEIKIKNAMIHEVHHRVKNNLQTIAFLLRMEARRAPLPETQEILRQTVTRVQSIAVVHEFLSRGDASEISIRDVCQRIMAEAAVGMMNPDGKVQFDLAGQTFRLPAQQATSCALAVNELLQNALEHGLRDRTEGRVRITLRETDASMVIEIADNGIGLPSGFDLKNTSSLGLQIVQTLVRDDLRGQLELIDNQGVTARISFPKELCSDRE